MQDGALVLRARLGRAMDGFDYALFKSALALRRKFLQDQQARSTGQPAS